ncbi:MAG TPA: protein kinase [Gemmatimonadales bacterium]|nr:protein kinase [Gemmatimonadales bacterium]
MPESFDRLKSALADRYALLREIGSGGMATVYLAEDQRHHRNVAVKVLRPELAATLGPERFSREIEIAAGLQHPHVLPLLDSGQADGFLYYVMPYVEGESLRDRLARQGELPIADAARILAEVADALAYAHGRGVVHRDIKPDNVLLSGRHALVTDFGVAKAVSEATGRQQLTTAGVALGTPAYMAPEQAAADPQVDHRADLYALGAVGYELLTGAPPFTGFNAQAVLSAHMTQAPQVITERRPGIPPVLAEVVMRALAKRPADRWQSAQEMVERLELLGTPSGGMTPTSTRLVATPRPRRSRTALWAGFAGAAVALAAVAVLALRRREPPTLVLGRATQVTFDAGLELDPTISPDGKLVAYVRGAPERMRLFVRQLGGAGAGQAIAVTPDSGSAQRQPHWSPDGTRLLYHTDDGLYDVPALGGRPRLIAHASSSSGGASAAWSPDGRRIVFSRGDTLLIHAEGGTDRQLAVLSGSDVHSYAWSPDGSLIAMVAGNSLFTLGGAAALGNIGPSAIWIVPAGGGKPVHVTDAAALNTSPTWLPASRGLLFVSNRDGPRDVYRIAVTASGEPSGPAARVTYGLDVHSISLTPDGRHLTYASFLTRSNVWAVPVPSEGSVSISSAREITTGNQFVEGFAVSRDGRWLYFDSNRNGNQDLFRMPLAGGEPEQLTTNPADDFLPDPSPDGREVAFHGVREGGRRKILVIPAAGGAEQVAAASAWQDRYAQWSPDGRAIAFSITPEAPPGEVGLFVVRRNADGSWGTPKKLYDRSGFATWSADGRSLLLNADPGLTLFKAARATIVPVDGGSPVPVQTQFDSTAITVNAGWWENGRTLGLLPILPTGAAGFWLQPVGGRARLAVRFDDPTREIANRGNWAADGKNVYVLVEDRESDIYVADVGARPSP